MRNILLGITILLVAQASPCASQSAMARQGSDWVQTFSGREPMGAQKRLRIQARGGVVVRGTGGSDVTYAVKVRVRSRHEEAARELLRNSVVRPARQGQYLYFVQGGPGVAELQVNVPHALLETTVQTTEGDVELSQLDGLVRADTGGGTVKADGISGNLQAHTAGGDMSIGTVTGTAHCVTAGGPISANVIRGEAIFESGGGDIVAQEVVGLVRASTAGGRIRIVRAGSAVVADTQGGPIEVGRAAGMVTARNSAGSIQVGGASGVRCESASGAIRLMNVSGSLRASTAAGSILAQLLAGQPVLESFLTTGRGDITVVIPSNVGVTVRAYNELADSLRRIVSDFPGLTIRMQGGAVVAEGAINGGGPLLKIAGNGGTIYIKRQ
jgi:DUF4097 and DUF4098 domain-containing protein YvlB